jgi:hypothetical protein
MRDAISDDEGQTMIEITTVERGSIPRVGTTPTYLKITGRTPTATRTIFFGEDAARDLAARLHELFGE